MTAFCPNCGNDISEEDYSCPSCGKTINKQVSTPGAPVYGGTSPQHTSPMQYPNKQSPRKSKKKLIIATSIILIAIVVILVLIFFILPQGDKADFIGTWDVTTYGTSYQTWAFYEDGTVEMASTFGPLTTPSISCFADDLSDTLTVAAVDSGSYSPSTQSGTYRIDGGKVCITAGGMELCFNYDVSNNGNTVTLTGMGQFTLTKTSSEPAIPDDGDDTGDLKWEDIGISGDCDTSNLGTYVLAGDQITSCSGTITIRYIPTNTLLGSWEFT